jgi:hypothetical protein
LLKLGSRTLYHIYTASIIAALGISMISTLNLNNSPAILPSAVLAAQQQEQKFTAKMTGSEEVPPKILRQEEQPNLFSAQMARP